MAGETPVRWDHHTIIPKWQLLASQKHVKDRKWRVKLPIYLVLGSQKIKSQLAALSCWTWRAKKADHLHKVLKTNRYIPQPSSAQIVAIWLRKLPRKTSNKHEPVETNNLQQWVPIFQGQKTMWDMQLNQCHNTTCIRICLLPLACRFTQSNRASCLKTDNCSPSCKANTKVIRTRLRFWLERVEPKTESIIP